MFYLFLELAEHSLISTKLVLKLWFAVHPASATGGYGVRYTQKYTD